MPPSPLSTPYLCLPPLLRCLLLLLVVLLLPLLHHPISVALLFIAMSSQGSAATKAFSCCHYNYSLHTCTHTPTDTHAYTHKRRRGAQQQHHCVFVSACVCVVCACSACAVIHKRVSYFYLSPSLSSSPSHPLPPTLHPSLLLLPATFAMLSTGSISRAPTSLLSHTELAHTSCWRLLPLGIPQISSLY